MRYEKIHGFHQRIDIASDQCLLISLGLLAFYESKRVKDSSEYIREHESQIILFKSSEIYFKRKQLDPKEINLSELFEQYKRLIHHI